MDARCAGDAEEAVSENVSRRCRETSGERSGSGRVFIASDGDRHVGMDARRPLTR